MYKNLYLRIFIQIAIITQTKINSTSKKNKGLNSKTFSWVGEVVNSKLMPKPPRTSVRSMERGLFSIFSITK